MRRRLAPGNDDGPRRLSPGPVALDRAAGAGASAPADRPLAGAVPCGRASPRGDPARSPRRAAGSPLPPTAPTSRTRTGTCRGTSRWPRPPAGCRATRTARSRAARRDRHVRRAAVAACARACRAGRGCRCAASRVSTRSLRGVSCQSCAADRPALAARQRVAEQPVRSGAAKCT